MATISIFPGEDISINGMNGFTVKDAVITEVEVSSPTLCNNIVYHFKAEATSVAIGNHRVPPHFPRVNLSMGECIIEIDGQKIHGQIESYQISLPYCQEFLDSFSTRMPRMERKVTFSFVVNSIDLEYEATSPEKKKEDDRPIDNRWEILDL